MGFLDFLKKDKPAPYTTAVMPPSPLSAPSSPPSAPSLGLPSDPSQIDWNAPLSSPKEAGFEDEIPLPPKGAPQQTPFSSVPEQRPVLPPLPPIGAPQGKDLHPNNPVPTATMLANPIKAGPIPPGLDTDDLDKLPLPPADNEDPDFLDSAADDFAQPKTVEKDVIVERIVEKPVYIDRPAQTQALPDFSEEDLALLDTPVAAPEELPSLATIPVEMPLVPPPANAVAIPEGDIMLPTGELLEVARIEPAKFISSSSYFMILAEDRAVRKRLRVADEAIKDTTLRHEQLDLQYKRVAADINQVQEHLIRIEHALFE
jgi:hypothetical protein